MSQERLQALEALEAGDAQGAYQALRPVVEYPTEDPQFEENLVVLARVLRALDENDLGDLIVAALATPDDPQHLYDLGYELIEHGLYAVSAHVLRRANALVPGVPTILAEFVHALETLGYNADACDVLEAAPALIESDFLCRYLLAFNLLMCARVEDARALLEVLLESESSDEIFMAQRIETMITRADALTDANFDLDLRAWHFIQHGALLTHISPYGFEEGMSGRYAFLQESNDLIHEGLLRLQATLEVWARVPDRVYMLPSRGSQILGHAIAELLDVPLLMWPEGGTDAPGLVVTHDLYELSQDHLSELHNITPGQLLFTQASCWTNVPPYASDITTFFYQVNTPSWAGHMRWDEDTEEMTQDPADERPARVIAAEILNSPVDEDAIEDLADMMRFARVIAKIEGNAAPQGLITRDNCQRQRFWECSPIKSNRF